MGQAVLLLLGNDPSDVDRGGARMTARVRTVRSSSASRRSIVGGGATGRKERRQPRSDERKTGNGEVERDWRRISAYRGASRVFAGWHFIDERLCGPTGSGILRERGASNIWQIACEADRRPEGRLSHQNGVQVLVFLFARDIDICGPICT